MSVMFRVCFDNVLCSTVVFFVCSLGYLTCVTALPKLNVSPAPTYSVACGRTDRTVRPFGIPDLGRVRSGGGIEG